MDSPSPKQYLWNRAGYAFLYVVGCVGVLLAVYFFFSGHRYRFYGCLLFGVLFIIAGGILQVLKWKRIDDKDQEQLPLTSPQSTPYGTIFVAPPPKNF